MLGILGEFAIPEGVSQTKHLALALDSNSHSGAEPRGKTGIVKRDLTHDFGRLQAGDLEVFRIDLKLAIKDDNY